MMSRGSRLISHRGNIAGKTTHENDPEYIISALDQGYDVEIDVNFKDKNFWLGHDNPKYKITSDFLNDSRLWCHLKDKVSLKQIVDIFKNTNINYFWHTSEDFVITSKGYIWHHSESEVDDYTKKSIVCLPELKNIFPGKNLLFNKIINCHGICSDYINMYV